MTSRLTRFLPLILILSALFVQVSSLGLRPLWSEEVYGLVAASGHEDFQQYKKAMASFVGTETTAGAVTDLLRITDEKSVIDTVRFLFQNDRHHFPLYYVFLKLFADVFGDGTELLRLLSVIFFLLSFPALWWFAKEAGLGRETRIVALAIFALSPVFLFYGQMIREYGCWTLFLILANASFLRAIRLNRTGPWMVYAGILALTLLSALFTLLILPAQALIAWRERRRLRFVLAVSLAILPALPLLIGIATGFSTVQSMNGWAYPENWNLVFYGSRILETLSGFLWAQSWPLLGLIPLALCGYGLWRGSTFSRENLAWMVVIPFLIFILHDLARQSVLATTFRYLLVAFVPMTLLLAVGIQALFRRIPSGAARIFTAIVIIASFTPFLAKFLTAPSLRFMKHPQQGVSVARAKESRPARIVSFDGKSPQRKFGLARVLPRDLPWTVLQGFDEMTNLPAERIFVTEPPHGGAAEARANLERRFMIEQGLEDDYWLLEAR